MSWVEKTSGGRFRGVYRDAGGHRHSKVFARKAEAKIWLAAADTDRARGLWVDPRGGALAFRDWAERWFATRTVRPTTSAADHGRYVLVNPCRRTVLPRAARFEAVYLSARQIQPLLAAVDPFYRCLVLTAAGAGMRWGELTGLRRDRLDLPGRQLHIDQTLVEVNGRLSVGEPKDVRLAAHRVAAAAGGGRTDRAPQPQPPAARS